MKITNGNHHCCNSYRTVFFITKSQQEQKNGNETNPNPASPPWPQARLPEAGVARTLTWGRWHSGCPSDARGQGWDSIPVHSQPLVFSICISRINKLESIEHHASPIPVSKAGSVHSQNKYLLKMLIIKTARSESVDICCFFPCIPRTPTYKSISKDRHDH